MLKTKKGAKTAPKSQNLKNGESNHVQHYVNFFFPGFVLIERRTYKVKNRDLSKIEVPEGAFGFNFHDIITKKVNRDGKIIELKSDEVNFSKSYYYGGTIYTPATVIKKFPEHTTLIKRIKRDNLKKLIFCRTGNWREFEKGAVLIKKKTKAKSIAKK